MKVIVTGGAGFIGSALIRYLIKETKFSVLNIDKLTYAANLSSLSSISDNNRYKFEKIDICDKEKVQKVIFSFRPNIIIHLAAESHVDRSISDPAAFLKTNIMGTFTLLQASTDYYRQLSREEKRTFRFHHVSTDEVFGDLSLDDEKFNELNPYRPSSPYSASKASSDHLVRAWFRTYELPVIITNCSNNYGPFQFPEKLIPLAIIKLLNGESLPIYGDGSQIRDWLYVTDHAEALYTVATKGAIGEAYNIGGCNEKSNLEVVYLLCELMECSVAKKPDGIENFRELISFVTDRPGHDKRYAIDASKIQAELGWSPTETFDSGLHKTVGWYLKNQDWWLPIVNRP